jgi:hypothetical protein
MEGLPRGLARKSAIATLQTKGDRNYPTCAMQVPDRGYMQNMPPALIRKALTAIKKEAIP